MSSRQEILDKIRKVTNRKQPSLSDMEFDNTAIYKPILPDAITCFKNELEAISGQCLVVNDEVELFETLKKELAVRQLTTIFCRDEAITSKLEKYSIDCTNRNSDFEAMTCGITSCEILIARTGSVLVSSYGQSGRQMNVFPPIHIIIANASQLVDYPEEALNAIKKKYGNHLPSVITTITGPSRTADIEKTLVLGAHGPKELIVFVLKN
ncbi:MAG: LutC/YkgG family protein [Paludibacter sp.]